MADIKKYSDGLFVVIKKAGSLAAKYYHTWVGTPHLFMALFAFLNNSKDESRYVALYNKMKETLNSCNIDGQKFKDQFLLSCPVGAAPEEGEDFEITVDREYEKILQNLERKMIQEKRTMEVEDLILELFADKSYTLQDILSKIANDDAALDNAYNEVVKTFKAATIASIEDLEEMEPVLTNLNKWIAKHPQKVIGADKYVEAMEMALAGRSIRSAICVGPAGTGKTTVVYEFIQRIINRNVPEQFKDKIIYRLDPAALVAGARYRGDFEERLTNILNIVKDHPEVILFVDEAHMLIKAGDNSDGAMNAGNILKPYITNGEVQMILATTDDEYSQYIRPQKAFARRFHQIKINEPTREETVEILRGLLPVETKYFKKDIQEELVEEVVTLAERYTLEEYNPAKAINMLELACAHAVVFEANKKVVDVQNIIESIRLKYDIKISDQRYKQTKEALFTELLGQDDALDQICRNLKVVDKGLYEVEKPMFSMLLAGPSGTGKTESAKIIARNFFGSDKNLIKINMGEYAAEMDVSKLTGSSKGYVGYDDEPELISKVRQHPNSVVVFDEIEKANKSVLKVLLNILDEGEMTDNKGSKVSFRNTIVVFTTNLGVRKDADKQSGMGLVKTKNAGNSEKSTMRAIEDYFAPEFLGRLDDIVYFNHLSTDIIETLIERYRKQFAELSGLEIEFDQVDISEIKKNADITTGGARNLKKSVRKQIVKKEIKKEKEAELEASLEDDACDF